MASERPALDAPPLSPPSPVEQGNSPIEESHFLCSWGLRQVRPYLFDFICSVKPRFAGSKLVDFMASEFPSMPLEYYERAAEGGRLRQEGGKGRGTTRTRPTKSSKRKKKQKEEENGEAASAAAEEEEEEEQQSEQDKNVELADNATIRHLLHRHEPPALDLGPIRVLGHSPRAGLWAVGKPPGMPVHAAGGYRKNTVCGVLEAAARAAGRGPPGSSSSPSPSRPAPPSDSAASSPDASSSSSSLVLPWPVYLHPLHRLDKPVSGVLLFAESPGAAERARAQLAERRSVSKTYVARVRGVFPGSLSELLATAGSLRGCCFEMAAKEGGGGGGEEREGGFTVDVALGWDAPAHRALCVPGGPKYLAPPPPPPPPPSAAAEGPPPFPPPLSGAEGGEAAASAAAAPAAAAPKGAPAKAAATSFSLLAVAPDGLTSLVECRPLTGRTHQIRAHLGLLGHPIANDALYHDAATTTGGGGDGGGGGNEGVAAAAVSAPYPGPERPRLQAHGGERGAGGGGAGCRPAGGEGGGGGRGGERGGGDNSYISAADVAEILDQCGWVVGEEEGRGGGGGGGKRGGDDGKDEGAGSGAPPPPPPTSPLEAEALSACPFCPSLARPAAASELRPLWLHARSYRGEGWAFECPAPRWASEGFVPKRTSV